MLWGAGLFLSRGPLQALSWPPCVSSLWVVRGFSEGGLRPSPHHWRLWRNWGSGCPAAQTLGAAPIILQIFRDDKFFFFLPCLCSINGKRKPWEHVGLQHVLFCFVNYLFIYLFGCVGSSLLRVGFSLVAASGDYSSLRCTGFRDEKFWWTIWETPVR